MLSILQHQAKILEKELKERQKDCLQYAHSIQELNSCLEARDLKIEVLRAEIESLRGKEKEIYPCKNENKATPDESCVAELGLVLHPSEAVLPTQDDHMRTVLMLESKLEEARAEVSELRGIQKERETLSLELSQAFSDIKRRDEQLEFLMQVHEASSGYEWIDEAGPRTPKQNFTRDFKSTRPHNDHRRSPAGSARNAISILSSNTVTDSIRELEAMGVEKSTALAALEAAGGDLDRAALSLFPVG